MSDNKDTQKDNGKKKDNRSFCFCMHAQVDCLPGVVLDCNNHKRKVCPLVEEVLAVNKDKEKQVQELKQKFKNKEDGPKNKSVSKPENKSNVKSEQKKSDKKKDDRSFCFCMHAQVDCLPGVVLDCNNHKRTVCPLVEEVLAVNKEKEEQVKELKEKFKKKDNQKETEVADVGMAEETKVEAANGERIEKADSKKDDIEKKAEKASKKDEKKDNRAFCFCMGEQVNCLPGVVLDCNNHKRKYCPLLYDALPFNEEQKKR